jgi:hypothetical protein
VTSRGIEARTRDTVGNSVASSSPSLHKRVKRERCVRRRIPPIRQEFAPRVWSVYGALRSLAGASSGKCPRPENGQNKPISLPLIATGCRDPKMVRRGSTVRVRQRASRKALQMGICCCLARRNLRASRVRDGYILGLAGTRGHTRRLAAEPETCSRHSIASTHPKSSCKAEVGVACSDATLTPSFAREEVIGIPTTPDLERQPFRPPEVARATLVAHARTLRRRPRPTAHGCAFKRGDVPSRSMHCRAPSR